MLPSGGISHDINAGCRRGNYLAILFIVSKLFYIINVIGQLFFLNYVLATKYHTFGVDVVRGLVENKDWTDESYVAFPRVTLCDFKVRGQDMVNVHPYTVQCVLPINLYNEFIYVFLWYWMVLVAALSVLRFASTRLLVPNSHRPPDMTRRSCLCRIRRCELSLKTQSLSKSEQSADRSPSSVAQSRNYNFCPPPTGKHSLRALVHL